MKFEAWHPDKSKHKGWKSRRKAHYLAATRAAKEVRRAKQNESNPKSDLRNSWSRVSFSERRLMQERLNATKASGAWTSVLTKGKTPSFSIEEEQYMMAQALELEHLPALPQQVGRMSELYASKTVAKYAQGIFALLPGDVRVQISKTLKRQ